MLIRGRKSKRAGRGCDHVAVGFKTTCVISAYRPWRSILDTTCDKSVSDLRQVDALLRVLRLPHAIKLNAPV
jgi:hypothetical protein